MGAIVENWKFVQVAPRKAVAEVSKIGSPLLWMPKHAYCLKLLGLQHLYVLYVESFLNVVYTLSFPGNKQSGGNNKLANSGPDSQETGRV